MQGVQPYLVHCTFQYGANAGKRNRMVSGGKGTSTQGRVNTYAAKLANAEHVHGCMASLEAHTSITGRTVHDLPLLDGFHVQKP